MIEGGGFFYLALLWYAAPAFSRAPLDAAARLRIVLLLAVFVPGILGVLGILYSPLLWCAAVAIAVWRYVKRAPPPVHDVSLYATLAASIVVLWPPLVRPLLDGDSLLYHLPNAAAFVQDHSLWTARAPYWPYPAASELLAAGVFGASGRWNLPLCGMLPALLIVARIFTIARERNAAAAAASVAVAFVCMPLAAFQSGTLQNDLFLAAMFLEAGSADGSGVSAAVCALLKPFGIVVAFVAAAISRKPLRNAGVALAAIALWGVRDLVLLWNRHIGFSAPHYWGSTIAGNLPISLFQLAYGIATRTPQTFVFLALIVIGLLVVGARRFAIAGIALLVLYAVLPVSYSNGVTNYVTDASSLRYALPGVACGAAIGAVLVSRVPSLALGFGALAAWGAWMVLGVFWNDSYTHWAPLAAAIAVACAFAVPRTRGVSLAVCALIFTGTGALCAASRANGFYGDWMRAPDGKPTGAFAVLSRESPRSVLAVNVRIGAIIMASPRTRVEETPSADACAFARTRNALIFVGSNEDMQPDMLRRQRAAARSCGRVVYEDGAAIIVRP